MSDQTVSKAPKRSFKTAVFQFLRFGLVGLFNTFLDLAVFNIIVKIFPTQDATTLVVFNSIAYFIGAFNSFFWNKLWTFGQHSTTSTDQVVRFALVTSVGILCNDAFLWMATSVLNSLSLQGFLWTNVAKIVAIGGSALVSFFCIPLSAF